MYTAAFELTDEQIVDDKVELILIPEIEKVVQIDFIAICSPQTQREEERLIINGTYCIRPAQINPTGTINFNRNKNKLQVVVQTVGKIVLPTKFVLQFKVGNNIETIEQDLIEIETF